MIWIVLIIPIFLITKLWFKTVRNEFRVAQPWYVLGICIMVLQKSRTHRRDTHIYKHIHPERFILGIGSYYDYGVQEVLWFTVCMSENRKAGGVIQSETKRSEKQRADVQRQEKMDVPAQAERENCPPLPFWYVWALSGWNDTHPSWGDSSTLFGSPIQTLTSSRNPVSDTPWNDVLPAVWVFLSPIKSSHKINLCRPGTEPQFGWCQSTHW